MVRLDLSSENIALFFKFYFVMKMVKEYTKKGKN